VRVAELVDADPGAGGGAITGHLDAADPMPSIPATLDPPPTVTVETGHVRWIFGVWT
jgi:hypothetical protein